MTAATAAAITAAAFLVTAAAASERDEFDGSRAGRHFALPIGHKAGKPCPLGPTLVSVTRTAQPQDAACTMNFAVSCSSGAADSSAVDCVFKRMRVRSQARHESTGVRSLSGCIGGGTLFTDLCVERHLLP